MDRGWRPWKVFSPRCGTAFPLQIPMQDGRFADLPRLRDGRRDLIGNRALLTGWIYGPYQIIVSDPAVHIMIGVGRRGNVRDSLVLAVGSAAINVIAGHGKAGLLRRRPFQQNVVGLLIGRDPEQHDTDDPRKQDCQNRDRQK